MRNSGAEHSVIIRAARDGDAEAIEGIYNHYILNTVITFEEETITAADMRARMADVAAASLPWLVAELHGFRKVAHLSELGFKFGRWIDVGYWQMRL